MGEEEDGEGDDSNHEILKQNQQTFDRTSGDFGGGSKYSDDPLVKMQQDLKMSKM